LVAEIVIRPMVWRRCTIEGKMGLPSGSRTMGLGDDRPPIQPVEPKPAESFGWMRRPELDDRGEVAWERPDGTIEHVPHGFELLLGETEYGLTRIWRRKP
jgi:hypothetical protein